MKVELFMIGKKIELKGNSPLVTEWQRRHCTEEKVSQRPFNEFDKYGLPTEFDEYMDATDRIEKSRKIVTVLRADGENKTVRGEANAIVALAGSNKARADRAAEYLKQKGYNL